MAAQQDIPSDFEIQAVIKFLDMEKMSYVEIHTWLCAVYCANKVLSHGTSKNG